MNDFALSKNLSKNSRQIGGQAELRQIHLDNPTVFRDALNPVLTTIQPHFNAEFAEADAEITEKKLSENFSLKKHFCK